MVSRWKPVTPLGVPHQLTADDTYENYHIPEGAIVIANQWLEIVFSSSFLVTHLDYQGDVA
jgi:hypothetical protein